MTMHTQEVTASNHGLMDQATLTVGYWLYRIRKEIDGEFGEGFAQANPGLVGAALNAAALDQLAGRIGIVGQQIRDPLLAISNAIENKEYS